MTDQLSKQMLSLCCVLTDCKLEIIVIYTPTAITNQANDGPN